MGEIDGSDERRLAVENAIASAFANLENDFIGWNTLKDLMTTVFTDHAQLRIWFEEFNKFKNDGNENKLPMEYNKFEIVRDEIRLFLNNRINMSDDLTRISAMNYKNRLWHQFDDFNPKIFIKPMAQQNGIMYHIWGVPGSGKTSFGFTIIDIALKDDYYVICNMFSLQATLIRFGEEIKTDRKSVLPNFFRTVRMSDLIYKCILIIESGNRNIVVGWDEVSTFMHRQDAPTKSNIDISRFLRLIRKFNINIVFLEQIDEGLAATANEMLGAKIHKISRKKIHYMTRFLDRNYNEFLESVPDSPISFKTGDFAGFINDVDFRDMFEKIAIEDEGDKLQEIKKYVLNIINKNKEKPPEIVKVPNVKWDYKKAKKLIELGVGYTEVARQVGVKSKTTLYTHFPISQK